MSNHGDSNERFADMFLAKPKKSESPGFLQGSRIPIEVNPEGTHTKSKYPFPPELLASHMHEFEKNGKTHKVAELNISITYKIVKRGRKWFEAVINGHKKCKALIEINSATEACALWHIYNFSGPVMVDCTYPSYRKIFLYPIDTKLVQVPTWPQKTGL